MLNPLEMDELRTGNLPVIRFCYLEGGKDWRCVTSCRFRLWLKADILDLQKLHVYRLVWSVADHDSASVSSGIYPSVLELRRDLFDVIFDQQGLIGKPYMVGVFLDPPRSGAQEIWSKEFADWGFPVAKEVFRI